jgi:hypothetical protein
VDTARGSLIEGGCREIFSSPRNFYNKIGKLLSSWSSVFAFSTAYFLERLLRDYVRTDIQPNGELSDARLRGVITGSLPKWLCRNKEHLGAKYRGDEERRAVHSLWVWEIPN